MTTASSRDYYHFCRSSLRSVPADEVNTFHISGCMSGPHSKSFCNYLHSEIENLEERDFLTFRNETVKLLSDIQYKAEERKRQSQEVTTFQLPEALQATAGREYILTENSTSLHSSCAAYTDSHRRACYSDCQSKQPSRPSSVSAQPTSANVVVDDQQPGFSTHLQLHLHHSTTLLDYPVSLELFPVCFSISRWTHHSHFHPLNFNQHCHQCHLPLIMNSQDLPASPASRVSPNQRISLHKSHQTWPF